MSKCHYPYGENSGFAICKKSLQLPPFKHQMDSSGTGRKGKLALYRVPSEKSQIGKLFLMMIASLLIACAVLFSTNKVTLEDAVGNPTLL